MIKYKAKHSTDAMRDIFFEYSKTAYGTISKKSRNSVCVDQTAGHMGMAIGSKYVQLYFTQATKAVANDMIKNIRTAFIDILSNTHWMDEETKTLAKEKANAINQIIGYPDWYETEGGLELYYINLGIIKKENYFKNLLTLSSFVNRENLRMLNTPITKAKWTSSPIVINAFYNPMANSITFPAAILQPPYFRSRSPQYLNYGSIGQVIGHEITHGFDSLGLQFNKDGYAIPWWSNDTIEDFKTKADCFIHQYDQYRISELDTDTKNASVDGRLTLNENIADNGGIRAAFYGYKKYVSKHGKEPGLPGLTRYSPEQLFFISSAQTLCGSITKKALSMKMISDIHSPKKFRVIGPMSNMKEFSQIWKCPIGKVMNPKLQCRIW